MRYISTSGLSSQHKMYHRRKPKYTASAQQYQTNISQYPNIKKGFDTNYETYKKKQQI